MKTKILVLSLLLCCNLIAEQKVVKVKCSSGEANTTQLESLLKQDWKVVSATPVVDSDSMSFGKPKQGYTASIVYILEKQ